MKTIFVYGTLKRGFPNYNEARLASFYLCDCITVDRYALVITDQYYVPVLLIDGDESLQSCILGELYLVDEPTLVWLDKLESVGKHRGYQRIEIEVQTEGGEIKIVDAYMKHEKDIDTIHTELSTRYELDTRYILPALRTQS